MKKITISGREFEYKIFFDSRWDEYETHFYLGTKKETFRKYLFFGPKITVDMSILAFKFNDSIESNRYSKEELKKS